MQNSIMQIEIGVFNSNENMKRYLWKISWPLTLCSLVHLDYLTIGAMDDEKDVHKVVITDHLQDILKLW